MLFKWFFAMELKVTDNSFKRIAELIKLELDQNLVLRVSVDGGGCSGFMYKYELITAYNILEDDYITEKDGIKVVVDPVSKQFLSGCVIDFVEQLGSSYFEIKNPNATSKCGCGNSFSI